MNVSIIGDSITRFTNDQASERTAPAVTARPTDETASASMSSATMSPPSPRIRPRQTAIRRLLAAG